ncbi:MAG: penicillin-binding protein 1C, partial [Synechococcaceae cyanobacterium SM2_3_60]|nr:penicillin-binding protein 1C [Synechococcaceae cyanobacterium SM2_3_60]
AALVIDNATAAVVAYRRFADFAQDQTDAVQALRQPGSTLKPFLYGLALDQALIEPRHILADVPTHYALPDARVYSPVDFSERFRGPVRVRLALANSLNIPAVRLLEQVGVPEFQTYLQQLGFLNLDQAPEFYGLGLALGGGEVSLWQLAQAFRLIPTAGQWLPLQTDINAVNVAPETASVAPLAIGTPSTWHLLADMLSDPQARAEAFGAESWLNLPFPAVVKTGTSSDFRDNWVVGSSAHYTVAVWVGNFDGRPMRNAAGEGLAAATNAAPLWHRIMMYLEPDWDLPPWPTPAGYDWLPICAWSGQRPQPDCPVVASEWVRDRDLYNQENDPTFHRVNGQLDVTLPPEYTAWLSRHDVSQLRITSPQPAATYLYRPSTQLVFRSNQASPVTWYLNDEPLGTTRSLAWPLTPGVWTLVARTEGQHDQLTFEVVAELPARESGFTLRRP